MIELFVSVLIGVIAMGLLGMVVGFSLVVIMSHPIAWVVLVIIILAQAFQEPKN